MGKAMLIDSRGFLLKDKKKAVIQEGTCGIGM
jgi:hypothetical protein